ncbi:MAG: DUF1566 domain-containing protein, partial [Desulfobacula sp.]|uniref:Lcl C-terminal domain-containing protein n=1 Tax=Desulfobacula sp. TaxID=2593537 RepID=UPI0025BA4C1C
MRIRHFTAGMVFFLILAGQCLAGYIDNGDGTITDTDTGLVWLNQTLGSMSFSQALNLCETGTWGNHNDWRLPDRNALQSIVDYSAYDPAIVHSVFAGTVSSGYWSSTINMSDPSRAWYVNFQNGVVSYNEAGTNYYVRPVRGGDRTMISA